MLSQPGALAGPAQRPQPHVLNSGALHCRLGIRVGLHSVAPVIITSGHLGHQLILLCSLSGKWQAAWLEKPPRQAGKCLFSSPKAPSLLLLPRYDSQIARINPTWIYRRAIRGLPLRLCRRLPARLIVHNRNLRRSLEFTHFACDW